MSNKKTCADALTELSSIITMNKNIQTDYDNQVAQLQTQKAGYIRERDAIIVPSRNVNDYKKVWTDVYYGCDGARYDGHRNQCNEMNVDGFGSGAYEWDGQMKPDNTGMFLGINVCLGSNSGCCQTRGECSVKQSFIDGLANTAQAKKDALNKKIDQIINEIAALKPKFMEVPTISCCQTMNFDNVNANQVTFDKLTQQCSVSQPPPTAIPGPSPGPSPIPTPTPAAPTSNYKALIIFIVFFIVMILIGLGIFIFADDLGLGGDN